MTHEEILKKAIEKAIKNGYRKNYGTDLQTIDSVMDSMMAGIDYFRGVGMGEIFPRLKEIIFSHDFAKAFFGNKSYWNEVNPNYSIVYLFEWQYHLQQMVLEEDPIKYLERFL